MGMGLKELWSPHTSTPRELKQRLDAERTGLPHVIYRDHVGRQIVVWLGEDVVTIGRVPGADVCLSWDSSVSRVHAELHRLGDIWTLVDDGLSRNGSFLNGRRVTQRRRLEDGDVLTFGATNVVFRAPDSAYDRTEPAQALMRTPQVSPSELCVLIALCRPLQDEEHSSPATNRQIADELCLSIPAVKRRLGVLFDRFGLEGLSHNEKRAKLADLALKTGLVAPFDFFT